MKKTLCGVLLLMILFFSACGAPAAEQASEAAAASPTATPVPSEAADPVEAAATVEELETLINAYIAEGDYEAALRCVDKILEIDPENQDVWYAQAEIRILQLKAQYDSLNDIIAQGMEQADDPAGFEAQVSALAEENGVTVELPFIADYASEDEINTYGVTSSNYYNGGGIYGEWQNGIITSQGDWVYYSVPSEDYAIYKMRSNRTDIQRVGGDSGCCLNVVGDWIYYCNLSENDCIFKMRTDGSERTQVSDDNCKYMAVCGDWIVYASMNEGESLYIMKLDGSERTLVVQSPVMYPYLYGGRIYFRQRDERSFYSVATDGSDLQQLAQYTEGYCIEGDWIYYITDDDGMVIDKMQLDGSEQVEVLRFDGKANIVLFAGGRMIVEGTLEGSDYEQVVAVDLDTMTETVLVDEWCEALFAAGSMGYYLDYEDGNAWYYIDLVSGETGKLE